MFSMRISEFLVKAVFIVALLAMLGRAEAELQFKSTIFEATAGFDQESVPFEFSFMNVGDDKVQIDSVETSCACTTSGLEKKVYLPGDVGEIKGIFKVGNRQGTHRQHVHVNTASGEIRLDVVITIPSVLNIMPRLVNWGVNEPVDTKTIVLTPHVARGVQVKKVGVDNKNFHVELLEKEGVYHLTVTPVRTRTPSIGLIRISTVSRSGATEEFYVYAMVR